MINCVKCENPYCQDSRGSITKYITSTTIKNKVLKDNRKCVFLPFCEKNVEEIILECCIEINKHINV